jgi:hypothetical protein
VVIPAPREDDFEDVHWALSAANTLWERGEDAEALKWLRRAASAAADRDADVRAVELFKAAADVAGVVDARQQVRESESEAAADSSAATQAMRARKQPPRPVAPAPAPPMGPPAGGTRPRSRAINRGHASAGGAQPPQHFVPRPQGRSSTSDQTGPPPPPRTGPPPPNPRLTQAGPPAHLQPVAPKESAPAPRPASSEPRDLVPKVPPEPTLSERFAGLPYKADNAEEDTFIRPETMLRRALMAIDPNYAERTEIDTDDLEELEPEEEDSSPGAFTPERPYVTPTIDDEEEDTAKRRQGGGVEVPDDPDDEKTRERVGDLVAAADRRKSNAPSPAPQARAQSSSGLVPGLAAFRVAVLPIPEERDVRLIFIPPGADPPPGVATALLVPPSPEDARLINEIYNDTDAKL